MFGIGRRDIGAGFGAVSVTTSIGNLENIGDRTVWLGGGIDANVWPPGVGGGAGICRLRQPRIVAGRRDWQTATDQHTAEGDGEP
jgi:hypothetical protein